MWTLKIICAIACAHFVDQVFPARYPSEEACVSSGVEKANALHEFFRIDLTVVCTPPDKPVRVVAP